MISKVFIDTGAWIALAATLDPFHERARRQWEQLFSTGARLFTSVPVVLETFTFLDRKGSRPLAIRWKDSLATVRRLKIFDCTGKELDQAWSWIDRPGLHRLSLVDATSFALMTNAKIKTAFAFDTHFAAAGFRLVP